MTTIKGKAIRETYRLVQGFTFLAEVFETLDEFVVVVLERGTLGRHADKEV